MHVAVYFRRFTKQELLAKSLVNQEELLRAFATLHEYNVVETFRITRLNTRFVISSQFGGEKT